ncbi:MAG: glycosyltransferase family 2 protein [archaeon]
MNIVVTIPAFNEEKTVAKVLDGVNSALRGQKYQVLVVDDGSSDNTAKAAREKGALVVRHSRNYGLAETFRTEMQKCLELKPDVIVHIDADNQYSCSDIPRLIQQIGKGYDLVLGSRFKGRIEGMPLIKRLGNRAFSKVISNITQMKISDGQTGFRAFTREVAEKISIVSKYTYTQEQIIRAANLKFRIKEIPVTFSRRNGKSRLMGNPFEYAIKAWITIFRVYRDYEPLKFFGLFGGLFCLGGVGTGLWIVINLMTTGTVGGLPRVMLTVLLLSIGIQIWLFGFLADMFRKK